VSGGVGAATTLESPSLAIGADSGAAAAEVVSAVTFRLTRLPVVGTGAAAGATASTALSNGLPGKLPTIAFADDTTAAIWSAASRAIPDGCFEP
jgi:hypothetical protein